jgi:hypothetical protein
MPIYVPGKVVLAKEFTWNETVWNPSMITTALWLDAADASTVTTVSSAVSQWNDKSGNGRNATQSTAGYRPTYTSAGQNGLNVLTFDGTDDWLALPNTTNPSGGNATFVACKPNHVNTVTFIIGRAYTWGSWQLASAGTGTTVRYGMGRDGIDEGVITATGLTNNTDKVLTGTYDNANVRVSSNGNTFVTTAYTPNPTYNANDATTIGAARTTSNVIASPFRGPMYEIVVIHSAPSQTVIEKMQGYLAHKWGLTASLPAGHPYKTVGPTP